jgi:DNA polymerase-1
MAASFNVRWGRFRSWGELPFEEIWCVDTEFYPGRGLNNGGRDGDPSTPLCVVARELRSNRVVRQWQDEFGPLPPYRIDDGALVIGYTISAELGTHIALGWPKPAYMLDPYIEFRHFTNDGSIKGGGREKGFYSIDGALRYFGEDGIDAVQKKDMRARILQGPSFTNQDRADIMDNYCQSDVDALVRLVPHIIPTIRSLPHTMMRAEFMWATAQQERRGIPVSSMLDRLKEHWTEIQRELVAEMDAEYGVYEIGKDGKPHMRRHLFDAYIRRHNMAWPTYADGSFDMREETFKDMIGRYPQIETLRELRYSLSALRLNSLAVGTDNRNRTLLGPYGSKTGRNQPSNSKYLFGPAKWIRFLITPPRGRVLIHRDYKQQEVRIAAHQSGDMALLRACRDDVYLGLADQLGFLSPSMSPEERKSVRTMFKSVVLGILYGLAAKSLAIKTGISLFEAAEILARLRAQFHVFEDYANSVLDHAGLNMEIGTPLDWRMQCPPGIKARTVRNFPIQSTGAEILHIACILAERRGIEIIAPVHDALMAEADLDCAEEVSAALDQVMGDAAAIVLKGHRLPTDEQIIRPGEHYFDDRGEKMWNTVCRILRKLEG